MDCFEDSLSKKVSNESKKKKTVNKMIGFSHRPTTGKGKLLDELLDLFIFVYTL